MRAGSGLNLEGPGSVAQALGILALIVTVHESGHFLAARWQGIHVTKFAIGFGPAVWTYQVRACVAPPAAPLRGPHTHHIHPHITARPYDDARHVPT